MLCVLNSSSNSLFSCLYFPIFPLLSETSTSPSKFSLVSLKIFHILNFQGFFFFLDSIFSVSFLPSPTSFLNIIMFPFHGCYSLRLRFLFNLIFCFPSVPLFWVMMLWDFPHITNCCLLTVYSTLSEVIKSCLKLCVGGREGVFWYLVGFSTRQKVANFFFFNWDCSSIKDRNGMDLTEAEDI